MSESTWFGHPPANWRARRLKYVAPLRTSRADARPDGQTYIGLENIESWTGRLVEGDSVEPGDETGPESQSASGSFTAGDVLFGKLRPYLAKAWLADRDGVCTTELLVLQPNAELEPRFLHFALLCPQFIHLVDSSTFGARMPRANWDFIGSLPIPLPCRATQRRVVDYIEEETTQIDALIAEKRRMLALLEEKRSALVSRAVTRGLNPDVPLKPSGLEWIGEIPAHWRVVRLKHFARIGNGSTPNRDDSAYWQGGHYPWLNSSVVNSRSVREASRLVTDQALAECHLPRIAPPALLIAITGQGKTRGRTAVLAFEATINQHLAFVQPHPGTADCMYLSLLIDSAYDFLRSESDGAGSTRGAITTEQLGNFAVCLPPLSEQAEILRSLEDETGRFSDTEECLQRSIELLIERRSALITAAVTGQLPAELMRGRGPVGRG